MTENGSLQSPQLDSVTFTFPGIAPKAPVITSSEFTDGNWGNSKTADLQWVEPVDTPAPVWAYYYSIDAPVLSGTALLGSAYILSKTVTGLSVAGLSDGIHAFHLVSQGDPLEYPNSPETVFTIKKDTVVPDPVAISSPTHPTIAASANDSPVYSLVAADSLSSTDVVSDIAGYVYVLDSLATSLPMASSPFSGSSTVAFSGLPDGTWWFHARAKDNAGNLGAVGHYPINISYKGRVGVTITSSTHPQGQESASNSPRFSLAVSNPDSATLVGYHYILDGNATTTPAATDSFTTSSELGFDGLRNQQWYLHVSVKNVLGVLSNPAHYAFKVNFQGHIIEESRIHAVPHPIRGDRATLRYELLAPAEQVEIELMTETGRRLRTASGTVMPGTNNVVLDVSGLANGVYFCRFKVRKQDGKEDSIIKKLAIVR